LDALHDRAHEPQDRHVHPAFFIERDRRGATGRKLCGGEAGESGFLGSRLAPIATLIFLPSRPGGAFVEKVVNIDPLELEAAQQRDASNRVAEGSPRDQYRRIDLSEEHDDETRPDRT
jgi:hypothetical protein